jgi:hypothetical protein
LVNGKYIHRLLLRFVYIHLVQVINIYRAAATKDRVEGQVSQGVGERDSTVAIDIYLAAKKKDSKGGLSRTKLLDYCPIVSHYRLERLYSSALFLWVVYIRLRAYLQVLIRIA